MLVDGTDRLHNGTDSDGAAVARVTERNNAHIGTPTPGTISDSARYETAEYHAGGRKAPLAATSFSAAYARGWTGRGSVAAITSTRNADAINRTISNVETASQEAMKVAEGAATVTSGVMKLTSNDNIGRIDGILDKLDNAAVQLEDTMQAASRATSRMEAAISEDNIVAINAILADMRLIQADIRAIVSTSISTSENLQNISEAG